jgi:hypothetical protein
MFDRVRPIDADVGGTIKGHAPAEGARGPAARAVGQGFACGHCGARVQELRRGRCWGCYQAWAGLRPVGRGARCVVCHERRRDSLRLTELHSRWLPMCHGCATRVQRLSPVPYTIPGLRRALARDRRGQDRRVDAIDVRPFPSERRLGDRRQVPERTPLPASDTTTTTVASLAKEADLARGAGRAATRRTRQGELGDFVFELDLEDRDVMDVTGVVEVTPADKAAMAASREARSKTPLLEEAGSETRVERATG